MINTPTWDRTSPVGPRPLTRHRQVCLPRPLMHAVGISTRTNVVLDSTPEGILVTADPHRQGYVRRVLSSGQVVIPKKLLDAHAILETGRVYVVRPTEERASLLIIAEAIVTDRISPVLVAKPLQK